MKVRDWMTPDPYTVAVTVDLPDARAALLRGGVHHLVAVRDGGIAGMVCASDLDRCSGYKDAELLRVGDVMSHPVRVVGPDDTVATAAARMQAAGVRALPVVDGTRALVGIITTSDLLLAGELGSVIR